MPRTGRGRLAALTGFAATAALLVPTVVALFTRALEPLGRQELEYVAAFFFIAFMVTMYWGLSFQLQHP